MTSADATTSALLEMLEELMGPVPISLDDTLLNAGGNSLVAVMLANRIEWEWGVRPCLDDLLGRPLRTIAADLSTAT